MSVDSAESTCKFSPQIVLPGGKTIPLAYIEHDRTTREKYLAPHYGNDGDVFCMCRHEGVPMGVARRTIPYTVYYLYPLHRSDPPRHALGCPHRATVKTGNDTGETVPVLEVKDGKIQVNLGSPLYRETSASGKKLEENDEKKERQAVDRKMTPRGSLFTLLEVLWSEAELNIWRPWFNEKRKYGVIFHRLYEAADKIRVKRQDLSPLLYIPRPFSETKAAKIEEERNQFLKRLKEENGKSYYGYVLGILKDAVDKEGGKIALRLAHTGSMLWIERGKWGRARKKWFSNGETQAPAAILARVMRQEGKRYPWLIVEDIAILLLSDDKTWIPVNSGHERDLTEKMVAEQRSFRKPLTCEVPPGDLLPDFVLEDRNDRTYLEILGMMVDPGYRTNVVTKRVTYEQRGQAVWWWDVVNDINPPALPPGQQINGERLL
ncbi:MAG: DUF1173 family protein [Sulfuricaulis sp.]